MSKDNRINLESMTGSSLEYREVEMNNNTEFYEYSDCYEDFYDDDNEFHFEDDDYENDEDYEEEEEFDEDESPRLQKKAGRCGSIRKSLLDDIWDN